MGDGTASSKTGADLLGNRKFESISLQRRVNCELGTGATSLAGGRPAVDETKSGFVFASKAERTKLPHLPIGAEVNVTGHAAAGLLELAEMQREAELLYVRECWVAL